MAASFTEMFRILKSGRFAMIEFNNNNPTLFEAIKKCAQEAGFEQTSDTILSF
jgi:fructose/tagatose bisphosphate aldolase